jgi:hypothetical protein
MTDAEIAAEREQVARQSMLEFEGDVITSDEADDDDVAAAGG